MAYREKIAWLTLVTMLVAYGLYFAILPRVLVPAGPDGSPLLSMLILFGAVTIVQAIVIAIGSGVIATRARRAGEDRSDERDRAIGRRAPSVAYFVLMAGVILVGIVMPFGDARWKIANAALLAIVCAEAVRYALVILGYRRGWHG